MRRRQCREANEASKPHKRIVQLETVRRPDPSVARYVVPEFPGAAALYLDDADLQQSGKRAPLRTEPPCTKSVTSVPLRIVYF
jgi:hypothetical protein